VATRTALIAVMVWELRKSQGDTSVLSEASNSFSCALFLTKLTAEYGKVSYKKVVEDFISFPTV